MCNISQRPKHTVYVFFRWKKIQNNFAAYQEGIKFLQTLIENKISVVVSHDPVERIKKEIRWKI